jgi:hypothetical protein
LVDQLASTIEHSLGPREKVFAYRQTTGNEPNAYAGSPGWADFMASVRETLQADSARYALTADITNFFLYVDVEELERLLLERGGAGPVVRDLGALLRTWEGFGVKGLPQGIPPSSALGNFYLTSLDEMLDASGLAYRRYMDDLWVFADSYSDARAVQDQIETHLYELRLGLGGDKSRVRRAETALKDTETAQEAIDRRREDLLAEIEAAADDPYDSSEVEYDPAELDEAAVESEYREVSEAVRAGNYPDRVRWRQGGFTATKSYCTCAEAGFGSRAALNNVWPKSSNPWLSTTLAPSCEHEPSLLGEPRANPATLPRRTSFGCVPTRRGDLTPSSVFRARTRLSGMSATSVGAARGGSSAC